MRKEYSEWQLNDNTIKKIKHIDHESNSSEFECKEDFIPNINVLLLKLMKKILSELNNEEYGLKAIKNDTIDSPMSYQSDEKINKIPL